MTNACRIECFRCGENEIDNWAKKKAKKLHQENKTKIFCAREGNNGTILGFYDLSLTSKVDDPDFGKGEVAPFVYINYLAVLRSCQGQKLGTLLLLSALRRAHAIAINAAVYGIALRSLNERTTNFYLKQGFAQKDQGQHPFMVLPVWTLYDLFGKPPAEQVPLMPEQPAANIQPKRG
jgi:GNAT superfamily N-acetyltransferase